MSLPRKAESPLFVVLMVLVGIYVYFIYPSGVSLPDLGLQGVEERLSLLKEGHWYSALLGEQDPSYSSQDFDPQTVASGGEGSGPVVRQAGSLQQPGQAWPDWYVDPLKDPPRVTEEVREVLPVGAGGRQETGKILQEGHWIGLEVIGLSPAVARANNIPDNVRGVLIDEVTLLAAESGLLAGDVITAINGYPLQDLRSFREATRPLAGLNRAVVSVFRKGRNLDIEVAGTEELGIAQMEAAPMITAAAVSPHGYYGPCDRCHTISKTTSTPGHLAKDQGDVLINEAPPISAGAVRPHRERGDCTNCHTILP